MIINAIYDFQYRLKITIYYNKNNKDEFYIYRYRKHINKGPYIFTRQKQYWPSFNDIPLMENYNIKYSDKIENAIIDKIAEQRIKSKFKEVRDYCRSYLEFLQKEDN